MVEASRVLAIIPARGGSKRLPRKNLLPLAGKPLIAWTIEAALESGVADMVVVTSDNNEILKIANQYGVVQMLRDDHLSTDTATTIDVIIDVLRRLEADEEIFDAVILLQPTSPLRRAADIVAAYTIFKDGGEQTVVSVCEVDHPIEWCGKITENGLLTGFTVLSGSNGRSQDCQTSYRLNGALYIATVHTIKTNLSFFTGDVLAFKMSRETSIDIDTKLDFIVCDVFASDMLGNS